MRALLPNDGVYALRYAAFPPAYYLVLVSVVGMSSLIPSSGASSNDAEIPRIVEELDPRVLLPLLQMGTLVVIHMDREGREYATGIVHIKAPPKVVWDTVVDYAAYGRYVPNIGEVKVLPSSTARIWKVRYLLKFKVLNLFSLNTTYVLEQHMNPMNEIWGIVSPKDRGDFSDVRFREYFIDDGSGNTIFVYTAYADLASFGYLAKVVYNSFPELVTPTLVSVGTLYPEAVKERIEGIKLNVNPITVSGVESVVLPGSMTQVAGPLLATLSPSYRVVLFHNPSKGGTRCVTGLTRISASADAVTSIIKGYESYPAFIPFITRARVVSGDANHYSVAYTLSFKVIFPLEIDYTLDYDATSGHAICWQLNKKHKHDINGEWGKIELVEVDHGSTAFTYTSYSNLASSGFFLRMMLKHIEGFDMGLRVALTDMLVAAYKKAAEGRMRYPGQTP